MVYQIWTSYKKPLFTLFFSICSIYAISQPENIVFEGDSNTEGAGTTIGNNYPSQTIQKIGGNYNLVNLGIGGFTTGQILANAPSKYPSVINSNTTYILLAGINDIQQHFDASIITSNIEGLLNMVKGLGCYRIIVGTYPAYTGILPPDNNNRLLLNQFIINNANALGYVVADHANSPLLSSWSPTYFFDYIHFNDFGASILAANTKNAFDLLPDGCQNDITPPVIIPKNTIVYLDNSGNASITSSDVVKAFTDNCGVNNSSLQISQSSFTCADVTTPNEAVKLQAYSAGSSIGNQVYFGELGMEFKVSIPGGIIISQLGAFDHLGNGITGIQNGGVRVAIYNKDNRTIVQGLDVVIVGNADEYKDNHRLKNINPVTLLPGNYVLVAKGYNQNELIGNRFSGFSTSNALNAGNGAINFIGSLYGDDNAAGFGFPKNSFPQSPNIFAAGTFVYRPVSGKVIMITGRDINGNIKQASANVMVLSSSAITVSNCPADIIVDCNNTPCTQLVNWTAPNATGGCNQNIQVQSSHTPGSVFPQGSTLVTYTFSDPQGQQAICSFTVTVNNTKPILSLEAKIANKQNVICLNDHSGSASVTVTSGNPGYKFEWSTIPAQNTSTATNLSPGNYTVTITDDSKQVLNLQVSIEATDAIQPVISNCPSDIIINCSNTNCAEVVSWTPPTAIDNCSQNLNVTSNHTPRETFTQGNTSVTYRFTDGIGNFSECSFLVTLTPFIPSSPLVASISSKQNVSCAGGNSGSATVSVSGGNPGYSFQWNTNPVQTTHTANNLASGNYIVTVFDSKNQSVNVNVTIDVLDVTPPVIPNNVTAYVDENGIAKISVAQVTPLITDNCSVDPSSISVSANQFNCPSVITVAPVITYQAYSASVSAGNQVWKGEMGMEFKVKNANGIVINKLGAFDHMGDGISGTQNGGIRVAIYSKSTHKIVAGLDVIISGNADGLEGNHRMKNISPVILLPGNYVVVAKGYFHNELNGNFLLGNHPKYTTNDGDGAVEFIQSYYGEDNPSGFTFPLYPYAASPNVFLAGTMVFENNNGKVVPVNSVTISARDMSGNLTTVNALVTIVDTIKPKVIFKSNVTLSLDNAGKVIVKSADIIQSATDNCGIESISISPAEFNCDNISIISTPVSIPDYLPYSTTINKGNQSWRGELGMEFKVNKAGGIIVKQLGAFDHDGDGISGTQNGGVRVAIYNKATRTIVPGLDVVIKGFADAYEGNHQMKNVSPVTLLPGNYILVAKGYNNHELNGNRNIGDGSKYVLNDGNGAISFIESLYGDDSPAGYMYPPYTYAPSPNVFLAGTLSFSLPTSVSNSSASSTSVANNTQAYATTGTLGNQAWKGELGMEFSVNNPDGIVLKQLGAFDHNSDGISGTQSGGIRVAIYNKNTKSIVPGLDVTVSGSGDALLGNHRMKNISPVTLPPGNYVLVAKGYNNNELNGNRNAGVSPAYVMNDGGGAISFIESLYGDDRSNGFNYPAYRYQPSPNIFLAGSFIFDLPGANVVSVASKNTVVVTIIDKSGNIFKDSIQVTVDDPLGSCNSRKAITKEVIAKKSLPENLSVSKNLAVFPNPSTGIFNVQIFESAGSKITVQIFEMNGKIVEQKEFKGTTGQSKISVPFNLGKMADGTYIIKVTTAEKVMTTKLLIKR